MKHLIIKYTSVLIVLIVFISGCKKDPSEPITPLKHAISDATRYDAKVAIDWMNLFRTIVRNQNINPPRAARVYAYTGITLYESVVEGIKNNKPLRGQLNGFSLNTIAPNTDSLDYGIVLNEALSIVAKCDTIIPALTMQSLDAINALHDNFLATKTDVVDSIITKSKARGKLVANAIMKYAAADNFQTVRTMSYIVPPRDMTHPWYWEPTDATHLNPAEPYWGQMRSFTMTASGQFEIPQNILFNEDTSSAFGRQAREVMDTVNNRTPAQNDIVLWWRDPTGTQTPAGHWIGILQYIIHQKGFKLDKAAELYAMVGITTSDAFISCWDAKYKYNLLRPETYIKAYMNSLWSTGQGSDPTPPFPEYPSGHSVCSGAAAEILTSLLGTVSFTDSINVEYYNYIPRSFASFNAAAQEAGISRLYGGIHYREAIESGLLQGKNLAQQIESKVKFK
jgi:hypothetical protein